jgi:outer membrane protein OmpA-like peptidoglycan-associated protein
MANHMDTLKNLLAAISTILLINAALSGCAARHEAVPGAYATPKNTPILAGTGAALGAVAGSAVHPSAIPLGAAIGGAAGGVVGLFTDSPSAVLKKLSKQDVQVVAVGQSLKLIIFSDKCFQFGTSDITNYCSDVLSNTAALLKMTGNAPITVAGYTDNNFGENFGLRLTREQADSVVAFLWAHGIPHERFYVKGYGSADPIATNYTTRGNGLNRRIEISLG